MLLALLSCIVLPEDTDDASAYEGDDPYECVDGADNDRDGMFDCDDSDCATSPDCTDADADADTDADTDTDTDADTDVEGQYGSVSVTFSLDWDFDDFWSFYGLEDCLQEFVGTGTAHSASVGLETFVGSWERVSDTCNADLAGAVWSGDGAGYHSLHLTGTTMTAWVVHAAAEDTDETSDAPERFSVFDVSVDLSSGSGEHIEAEDVYDSGTFLATLTSSLSVSVSD